MDSFFPFLQTHLLQFLFTCIIAFAAAVMGGISGFGTGLILPVFLSPVVGVANVIPVMAVAMLLNNGSRALAFREAIKWDHVRRLLVFGLPGCALGAYGYTLLKADWIAFALGCFLLLSLPLRRRLRRAAFQLRAPGEIFAGGLFGVINGGMTGTGVFLISLLLAAGVQGAALIATDAILAVIMSAVKVVLFGRFASLDLLMLCIGLLVGAATIPGAYLARYCMGKISLRVHAWLMEGIVLVGAMTFLWQAFH